MVERLSRDAGPDQRSWGVLLGSPRRGILLRLSVTPWWWYLSPRHGGRTWVPLGLTVTTGPEEYAGVIRLAVFVGPLLVGVYVRRPGTGYGEPPVGPAAAGGSRPPRPWLRRGSYWGEVAWGFTTGASEVDFLASMALGLPLWLGLAAVVWAVLDRQ